MYAININRLFIKHFRNIQKILNPLFLCKLFSIFGGSTTKVFA
jgi:hypothetical protein